MNQTLYVPVSIGEFLDKITILRIKLERINDPSKLRNISAELHALEKVAAEGNISLTHPLVAKLQEVNKSLWDIEDEIRVLERSKDFKDRFVELARAVYVTNDKRFEVKAEINKAFGSTYAEEKSYEKYL